ncbi:hypothetical protein F2Q69_00022717 [Brassica cretica]|uniref:Uncharacterized protein n=1 Tax=Brassica cretica TaxID=69181 RepID=A0A8S9QEG4_BRACR|nr:hypothetical protein F2Q69_00022717 [Brassica cretica]
MGLLRSSGDSIEGLMRMHGLMLYRRFGRARSLRTDQILVRDRSLRSDRAPARAQSLLEFGRYLFVKKKSTLKEYLSKKVSTFSSSGIWTLTSSQPFSTPTVCLAEEAEAIEGRAEEEEEDDFWQVVKEEKLQEGDFEVESLMSFGGSHWCRSMPDIKHRSTHTGPNRSTGTPEHRSMMPTESTASWNTVKILTHEEFAAKHQHADTHIDRQTEAAIDRQTEAAIDEHLLPTECKCQR